MRLTWVQEAACVGADPKVFMEEDGRRRRPDAGWEKARKICADCPVIDLCRADILDYPMSQREVVFAAGMTPAEIDKARRRRQAAMAREVMA